MTTDYTNLGMHIVSGMTHPTSYSKSEHFIALHPVKKDEYDGKLSGIGGSGNFKELNDFKIQLTYTPEFHSPWHLFYGYENIYSVQKSEDAENIFKLLKRIENAFERESNEGRYSHSQDEKIALVLKALHIRYVIEEKRRVGHGGYDQNEYTYMTVSEGINRLKEKVEQVQELADSQS